MKKFLLSAVLIVSVTGAFAQAQDSTAAYHYKTDDADCAIFPVAYTTDFQTGKRFTPDFPMITKAENALSQQMLLQKDTTKRLPDIYRHLKKYKRQYFGYINKDGHKILFINLFWDDDKYIKNWLTQMVMVQGGGSNYWNIKYDLTTDKVFDLQINFDE